MGDNLVALGGAFLTAGLLARAGRRVGLPTIPLFMAAGVLFGPHTPGAVLVHDPAELELVATLGLILLLFHLGLESSLHDLVSGGRRLLAAGATYLALNVGAGLGFGLLLGWGTREALVELHRLANPESRLILGIIVVEDVFLALYLAVLQPVLGGSGGSATVALEFARALAALVVLAAVARYGAHLAGRLVNSPDDELLTVCFLGLAVLVAGVSEELGTSHAIGAFMVGLILAETTASERVERLVLPLRDAFAALFFFAFGLTINPADAAGVLRPVAAAVGLSTILNLVAGVLAARIHRLGPGSAANIGLTILGRGEFSLILATLAAAAGVDERIGPFVALYVLVLAVTGPLLAARSRLIARRLPARLFPVRAGP